MIAHAPNQPQTGHENGHTAPHVSDFGENDPRDGRSQLLGVLGLSNHDLHVDFRFYLLKLSAGGGGIAASL